MRVLMRLGFQVQKREEREENKQDRLLRKEKKEKWCCIEKKEIWGKPKRRK